MLYGRKWREYSELWDNMKINPSRKSEFLHRAQYAVENRQVYLSIEGATGVPWPMTACMHVRESDAQDKHGNPLFTSYLGNGQPLSKRTTIEPIGRGPFKSFEEGAVDALRYDKLTLVNEWRLEKMLFYMNALNGFGHPEIPSPYLWGGTNVQKPGKYIRDHVWSNTVMDSQPGCAPMLWSIMQLEPALQFKRED